MKKIIHLFAAATLFVQIAAPAAFAAEGDSVTITGARSPRTRSVFTATTTPEDGNFSYQWYSADSEDGEYYPIIGATEKQYKLSTLDAGKYISVKATNNDDGQTVESAEKKTLTSLGPVSKTNFSESVANSAKNTPSDNLFYVDNQGFILLGEFNEDDSKYYVMSEDFYGESVFDSDGYAAFDPSREGNIGYFLNNSFLTDGNGGKKLPTAITDHIDYNHVWWTEKGTANGDCAVDYSFTAGISLISASEADIYYGTYGWQPNGESGGWWLRTQQGNSSKIADNIFSMGGENDSHRGNIAETACTEMMKIRPVFYLDKDFFKEVKLNANVTGKNIGKALKSNYTADELSGLYTYDELVQLGVIEKEFELKLKAEADGKLVAKLDNMLDQELRGVNYQWKYKTADSDEYVDLFKENEDEYVFSTEDYGRTITVEATPILADGTERGPYEALTGYTVSRFGGQSRTNIDFEERKAKKFTPVENLFTVGGQQFVLINEYADENSTFFIMSEDAFGKMMYDTDNTQKFDPEDDNNIGYFLNNTFLTDGIDEKKLPQDITDHIDFNHVWWTEAGTGAGNCPSDYSFTAGISLISKSEYVKYLGRFGWKSSDDLLGRWWGRTGRDIGRTTIGDVLTGCEEENNERGNMWNITANSEAYVRPVFYLDYDFFKDVKISDAGANVIKAIGDRYSVSELLDGDAGYTIDELIELGIITAPEISEISVDGNAFVNAVLKGEYTYSANHTEGDSTYGFEVSTDNINYIDAAKGIKEYIVKPSDIGKYIRFYCIPTDTDGISGTKAISRAIRITGTQDVTVDNMQINGTSLAGLQQVAPTFTLTNNTESAKRAVCIIALYDKNNYITAMKTQDYQLTPGESKTENSFSLSTAGANAKYARVFVVDSLESMNSLIGYEVVIR